MNASRFTLIAFVCLSLSDPPAEATAQQFDYRSQLGVVELGEQICLTIPNDKGKAGDIVHVIFSRKTSDSYPGYNRREGIQELFPRSGHRTGRLLLCLADQGTEDRSERDRPGTRKLQIYFQVTGWTLGL